MYQKSLLRDFGGHYRALLAGQLEGGVLQPEGERRNHKASLVLVADARRLFGEALGSALAKDDRLSVLSTVATRAHEAVDAVVSYRPDLVVYDLHLQGMETPAVLAALLRWAPATRVVLLAWYQGRPAVRRALISRLTTKLGVRTQLEALSIARNASFVCED